MSYRVGDHSTSDYSAAYRNETEMEKWKELLEKFSNPISRLEKYLLREGVITPDFIGDAVNRKLYNDQDLKKVWHYLAKFGDLN